MTGEPDYIAFVDYAVLDISKRVAKLELMHTEAMRLEMADSLIVTVSGDYCLTMMLMADKRVLKAITENMKRACTKDDHEIEVYTMEFFNILCGHVVSRVNDAMHLSAHFSIPRYIKGGKNDNAYSTRFQICSELYYRSCYGTLKICTAYPCR